MSVLSFFKRGTKASAPQQVEQKSYDPHWADSLADFLQSGDNWDLSFAVLIAYHKRCAPFGNAVNMISEAFSEICPVVRDIVTGELVPDHPILKLLEYPNDSLSRSDFLRHISSMYLITGNPFLQSIGKVTRPPLALDIVNPSYANIHADRAGDMGTINITSEFQSGIYRGDTVDGRRRFRLNDDLELWPVFGFNPDRGSRQFFSTPIAKPLYYDIEQYISSGQHNKSLLQRGARPGGSFHTEGDVPLTPDQFARMQDQINKYYMGANNAGRPLLLENTKYTEHIVSNRDMDYKTLVSNAKNAIYRQFDIPLPMVESATMTYANYQTAQVAFYDSAVLPHARFIYDQLGLALFYRYGDDWRRYRLDYEETEISALQLRQAENIKTKKQVGVHTVNELRNDFGDEPLDGGDVLLRPANEIPALEGNDEPPKQGDTADDDDTEKALRAAVDSKGQPRFDEQQIRHLLGRV
jgi:HK97 family phage portal protein